MMRYVFPLTIVFLCAAPTATAEQEPPHGEISTWVLLKLTDAGCAVRSDPTAMDGMQIPLRQSLSAEQYASISQQTLYLASQCNTRQAVAEGALAEMASGSKIALDPLRINASVAVYNVTGATEGVSALLVLTPLGDQSAVAVITMGGGPR